MSDLTLHDYQELARDYILDRNRAGLFLDMGLGKTAVVLSALEERHLPALVVAPKRVAENVWEAERDLWRPGLTMAVAAGDKAARGKALASDADVVVLGRDNLRDVDSLRRRHPFRTLVLDELSSFKNRASQRWKAARRLASKSTTEHVWGLTGTPSPNGYLDLWAQVYLLDFGERLGKNLTTYRSRYFFPGRQLPNGTIIEWILREGADDKIKAKLADLCLAMESDGRVKLPDVTFNDVVVDLPPAVRKAYRKLSDDMVVDLRDIFGGELHTAGNAATLTARLSQMTAGFLYVDDAELHDYAYTWLHDQKLDALAEIMEAPREGGVLVFYQYTAERDRILARFKEAVHINEPDAIKRWDRGEVPMLVAHPASAGHGLNLQHGGHTEVWTSPTWDLEHWEQGIKRLARQGQKHPVVIHVLLAKKTIDYLVRSRLAGKARVQDDLLDYLESPV